MNYLTNYYKNLSEQLQEKINLLESYLYDLNEGLEQEVIQQSSDFGAGAGTSTTSTNKPNNNSELNSFLQAWGTSNPNYDYNRDGVVDGDDLGVFLAGMLNRGGSSPVTMASTVAAATPRAETLGGGGAKTARAAKALDQPGLAKGSVNRMVDFGQGELLAAWGERPLVDPNSGGGDEPPPPQTNSESPRENIPYWMSGKTTELDTSFRSMQRRRRK